MVGVANEHCFVTGYTKQRAAEGEFDVPEPSLQYPLKLDKFPLDYRDECVYLSR